MSIRIVQKLKVTAAFAASIIITITVTGCRHRSGVPIESITSATEAPATAADEGIAISLTALAAKLREQSGAGHISAELTSLEGMTEIIGYLVDTPNRDLVLIGRVRKGAPRLLLDDFVTGLRVASDKYLIEKHGGKYRTNPAVSIDPHPETLADLNNIESEIFQTGDQGRIHTGIKRWLTVAQGPQDTRILGMPHGYLAYYALMADYAMKHIVDGTVQVPGITSLTDLHAKTPNRAASSLNRFWIVADPPPTYVQQDGAILLRSFPIGLKTEAETLINKQKIAGSGKEDPMAKQFCGSFAQHYYDQLVKQKYYGELASGFRWIGLTRLMHDKSAFESSGMSAADVELYMNEYQPAVLDIPGTLAGVANIKETKTPTNNGEKISWLMTVGGVDIGVHIPADHLLPDSTGEVRVISRAALAARPSPKAHSWRFFAPGFAQIARM